jgi:hypothetical protein
MDWPLRGRDEDNAARSARREAAPLGRALGYQCGGLNVLPTFAQDDACRQRQGVCRIVNEGETTRRLPGSASRLQSASR